jgi:uncharacterized Fe-S cluster-containing protein
MSACKGGCNHGPAMEKGTAPINRFINVSDQASKNDFDVTMPASEKLVKSFKYKRVNIVRPGGDAIKNALQKMGKFKPEDELNCGSCGYNTCRDKAIATIDGKADISMCLPYLMERSKSFSDTIINNSPNGILVLTETLEIQQMNTAACEITNVKHQKDVLGRHIALIMDSELFQHVVDTHQNVYEKREYLAEYDKYIMLTVIYDSSYNVVISLMRDVTLLEKDMAGQKEMNRKTMEITDKIIEKQMRTVQEIASLLGETAAETKVALTKLKETLSNDE